jgi:putative transposase
VDGISVPLALVVTGANRQLELLLDSIIIERPDIFAHPQHLCLDKGYSGEPDLEIIVLRGFTPHVKSRGQERTEKVDNPAFKARRWGVEAAHDGIKRFRFLSDLKNPRPLILDCLCLLVLYCSS